MAAVWHRTVICVGRLSPRHTTGVVDQKEPGRRRLAGVGRGCFQARLCAGHGALPLVSAGGAADHRRHHVGRGDRKFLQASESSPWTHLPLPQHVSARNLRLVLRLTAPGRERPRPQSLRLVGATALGSGLALRLRPPLTRPVGGEAWSSCVSVSPARPVVARVPHPLPWPRPAHSHALNEALATTMLAVPLFVPVSAAPPRVPERL